MKQVTGIIVERQEALAIQNVPDRLPVYRNFDTSDLVGYADVYMDGGVIKATLNVTDEIYAKLDPLNPAIGGSRSNGIIKITSIGLCDNANVDPKVKNIEAQRYA
jgi:hypothetical protein